MLLIFIFCFLTFANATLIIDIPSQYNIKILEGNITYENNQLIINGKGKIKFLKDDYESIPYEACENMQNLVLKDNLFYKCIDNNCTIKEIRGKVITKFENHIYTDYYKFIGKLKVKNNKFIFKAGKLVYKNVKYIGEFKNNLFDGYGILIFNLNHFHIYQDGIWENGKFIIGEEKVIYSDGTIYKGEAYLSQPDGYGTVYWSNGDKFIGYFTNGKKDGKGKYFYNDGSYFEGEYKNDLKNGKGYLYIKPLNIYIYGNYKNDKLDGLVTYSFDNNIAIAKFSNGKFIKVVKIISNDNISFIHKIFKPFLLYAWGFGDLWEKTKEKINEAQEWVESHTEHIINATKGCIGGAVGGCIAGGAGGAMAGAVAGGITGGPEGAAAGAGTGAMLGCAEGAFNGCLNQGVKAWENTDKDENYKVDMLEATKEEISLENMAWGAVAGGGGVFLKNSKQFMKILTGTNLLNKSKKAIKIFSKTKKTTKTTKKTEQIAKKMNKSVSKLNSKVKNLGGVAGVKTIKKFIIKYEEQIQTNLKRVKSKICKLKIAKKIKLCQKDKNKLKLKITSWNLLNFSTKHYNVFKGERIKSYIRNRLLQKTDIIFLQEVKGEKEKIESFFNNFKLAKTIVTPTNGENFVTIINPKILSKLKTFPIIKNNSIGSIRRPQIIIFGKKLLLYNVHLIFKNNTKASKIMRLGELKRIFYSLKRIMKIYKIRNFIIAGDFNLNKKELSKIFGYPYNISENGLTTSKNSYDHIITNMKIVRDMVSNIIDPSIKNVSDHKPINVIVVE